MASASDKSGLLTNIEMLEKKKSASDKNLFLDDGGSRIDCILAYEVYNNGDDGDDEEQAERDEKHKAFIENLKGKGLVLEEVGPKNKEGKDQYGTFEKDKDKEEAEVHYIKVHAPFDVLCDIAEDIAMKMPIAENDIAIKEWYQQLPCGIYDSIQRMNPFVIQNPCTKMYKNYFVARFDKERLSEFINSDKPDEFFTVAERGRLVYYILEKTKFGPKELDLGIFHLIHDGVFLDAYPLHDGPTFDDKLLPPANDRQRLERDWATPKRMFKYQPIPAIRDYFGEKVALYFAWLGLYTSFLVPAAIVGFLCFLYGVITAFNYQPIKEVCTDHFYMCPLCDKVCTYYLLKTQGCMYSKITHFFDNQATLFFALFMSIWATIFLEFWKRKQVSLAYEWHAMDFEEEEERPRPEYLASITKLKENPVTQKMEPYMPPGQKAGRLLGVFGVVVFFIVLVLSAVVGVIIFRAIFYSVLISEGNKIVKQRSKIINSAVAAVINLIAINLLKFVYQRIAVKLTDWENPRTKTDYEDSFTIKMFWFQFCNTYASIFYVAFFKSEFFTGWPGNYNRFSKRDIRMDGCAVQGCFLELTIQLIIIMVGQQIIGNIMEIVVPFLKNAYNDWKNKEKLAYGEEEPQWVADFECQMLNKFSLFWQYLEIVLQYGFVTMFVAAFPLAPLFALLNNMVEIRLDAVNFIHNFRRPVAQRAEDIGAWYGILATLTTFSTIVNAFVLAFTSDLIPRLTYRYYKNPKGTLEGYTNFSLSYFNVANFSHFSKPESDGVLPPEPYCRYPGYHVKEEPYGYSKDYWVILSARLAFIIAFQALVLVVTWAVAYVIPDMPKSLELKIKRETFLASEAEKDYKEKLGKRRQRPAEEKGNVPKNSRQTPEPVISPVV